MADLPPQCALGQRISTGVDFSASTLNKFGSRGYKSGCVRHELGCGHNDHGAHAGRGARGPVGGARNLRAHLAFLGPAVVASIAYIDPGNFATNIQAGAQYGYNLLWLC